MIQELISTSAPRCLNGNAGFGIVAQTTGMAANVSSAVNALSGYTHVAAPSSDNNPVVYLHAIRRTGGMVRHIVSRIADNGNDYSGRSNRIAHHWIVEEEDVRSLPGGPAELTAQNIFRSSWNEKPAELPPKKLSAADVSPKKCTAWEQLTGDAGWGGIVAERAEKGDPVSIIFTPEHRSESLRALMGEALALLPSPVRWNITFSTYYMKSHELSGDKIQVKCFLAGSEEVAFVRQSPNTLVIDLRQRAGHAPPGKYVELARGAVKLPTNVKIPLAVSAIPKPMEPETESQESYELVAGELHVPGIAAPIKPAKKRPDYSKGGKDFSTTDETVQDDNWWLYLVTLLVIILIVGAIVFASTFKRTQENPAVGNGQPPPQENNAVQLTEMQDENERLTAQIESQNQEIEKLKKDAEQNNTIQDLEKEKQNLVTKTEQYEQDISKLQSELDKWQTQENDRNKVARDKERIANEMKKLPPVWEKLALPFQKTTAVLGASGFLHEHRNDLKIDYVPFVKLQEPVTHEKIGIDYKLDKHTVIFNYMEEPKKTIAKIELTEKGLQFEWNDDEKSAEVFHRIKNRILLSKLRMTVGDASHEIALWTPYKLNSNVLDQSWVVFDDPYNFLLEVEAEGEKLYDSRFQPEDMKEELESCGAQKIYLLHTETNDKLLLLVGGR